MITGLQREELWVTGLEEYQSYVFPIVMTTAAGGTPARDGSVCLETSQAAPSAGVRELNVASVEDTAITLSWLPPPPLSWNGNITNYTITYSVVASCPDGEARSEPMERPLLRDEFANPSTHVVAFTDEMELLPEAIRNDGLEEFHYYLFSVSVWNVEGSNSGNGSICRMTTADVPSTTPLNVILTIETNTTADVSWDPPLPINHNGIINRYVLQVFNVNTSANSTFNTSETWYSLTELLPFTMYRVVVAAENMARVGPFSSAVSNMTFEGVPEAPRSLSVVSSSSSSISLSWQNPLAFNGIAGPYMITYRGFKRKVSPFGVLLPCGTPISSIS